MDPLRNHSSNNPIYFDIIPFSAAQAQHLLQRIGWTYFTIWAADSNQNPLSNYAPGLVWRKGEVNRSLLPDQNNPYVPISELTTHGDRADSKQISSACKAGYLLQQFYKKCRFLPLGFGSIAGVAMASGRYQWANSGQELLKQISSLSTHNRQHAPSDLQEHYFKTVVCIPLQRGAGVLEMGTETLVPADSDDMLQILASIHGLAVGTHKREEKILNSALKYGEPAEEHADTLEVMQMYGGTALCGQSSAASSPPSADHQKGSSGTSILNASRIPSTSDENMLISSPASSLQATSILNMATSSNQLDILSQLGHVGLHAGSTIPFSLPAFCDQQLNSNAAHQHGGLHASYDHISSPHPDRYWSTKSMAALSPLSSPPQHNTHYDLYHFPQNHMRGDDQQPQQGDKHKMIDNSCGESAQEASTEILKRLPKSMTPAAGNSLRACKDKTMEDQAAASRLEAEANASCFINSGYYVRKPNAAEASTHSKKPCREEGEKMICLSTEISKPAASCEYAGLLDKDDQYTSSNMQQGGEKDYYINTQMGTEKDHYTNKQQSYAADHYINKLQQCDHHIKLQQFAGTRSTAGVVFRYGAFKTWNKSLLAVNSYQRKRKNAAKESFLKKLLIYYLPRQQRETRFRIDHAIRRGSPGPLVGYAQNLRRTCSLLHAERTQNETAAVNHMYAERNRRSKERECYELLRSLVPNSSKKDIKVALLKSSIEYLKELKDRVCELEQVNVPLTDTDNEDNTYAMKNPSQHIGSKAIATCLCLSPSIFKDGNYFQLNVNKLIKCEDTNIINIEILSALQKKNLQCIKFKSEFQESSRKVDVEILAKYKDGENHTLSFDGIKEIEEWWPTLMTNFPLDNA